MSDITDLLQRMMQANMQLPNLKSTPIPGMTAGYTSATGTPSLFDAIQKFRGGQSAGGAFPGGNSLFAPPSDSAPVDDMGMPTTPSAGAGSDKGGSLDNRMHTVAQRFSRGG